MDVASGSVELVVAFAFGNRALATVEIPLVGRPVGRIVGAVRLRYGTPGVPVASCDVFVEMNTDLVVALVGRDPVPDRKPVSPRAPVLVDVPLSDIRGPELDGEAVWVELGRRVGYADADAVMMIVVVPDNMVEVLTDS